MALDVNRLDLAALTARLQSAFAGALPSGYVDGRTSLRDAVAADLGCSALEAERVVDTLISRGFVRFPGDPGTVEGTYGSWCVGS